MPASGSSPSHVVPAARWPGAAASFWPLPPASRRPRACAAACSAAWRSPCTGGFSGRSWEIHGKSMGNGWKIMGISPGYHRNMGKSWETNGDYLVFSSRNQAYSWVEGTFLWLIPRSLLTVGSASKTGWFKQFSRNQMVSPCFTHKNGGFNLTKKTTTSLRRLGGVWPQLKSCSHFTSQGRPRSIPASHHPNIYWHLFNSCIYNSKLLKCTYIYIHICMQRIMYNRYPNSFIMLLI